MIKMITFKIKPAKNSYLGTNPNKKKPIATVFQISITMSTERNFEYFVTR